ncbi:hypothetical protein BsWGS_10187 [Bradybaena similaris]
MDDTVTTAPLPLITPKVIIRRPSVAAKVQPKKKRAAHIAKSYPHPWMNREDLSDAYELPVSQREGWWRANVKITPVPGAYDETTFLDELGKRSNTYNFKAQSRLKCKSHANDGKYLLPGNYEFRDFIEIMSKKPATYRFKAGERFASDVLNFGLKDKNVNVAPNAYSTQKYLAINGEPSPVKNYMFRSQTKRFQYTFGPKHVPSPASYNVKDLYGTPPAVTSCFRSKTPRFPEQNTVNPL